MIHNPDHLMALVEGTMSARHREMAAAAFAVEAKRLADEYRQGGSWDEFLEGITAASGRVTADSWLE